MGPSPIITRYMAKHFAFTLAQVLLALLLLAYLFDTIELLRRTASREIVTFEDVLIMSGLKLFSMFHLVLPFAVLISSLFVLWRLSKNHELVIIRSAGVSVWQFMMPLILVAFCVGILNITVINPLAAATYKHYERMENRFDMGSSPGPFDISKQGLWLKETRNNVHYTIHASNVRQKGPILEFQDMSVFETSLKDNFKKRVEAEVGELTGNKFSLTNAWIMEVGKAPEYKKNIDIPTVMTVERIENNFSSPETISFWTIPSFISFFEQTGFSSLRHKLYWYSLLASPFFLVAMVLIAGAFVLKTTQRQGGVLIRVVLALSTGFGLFFFSKLAYALGASASIPLALSTGAPSLIAITCSIFILLHYEDG